MADPGMFSPSASEINFAVPDMHVLSGHDPYAVEIERKPGIYDDTISELKATLQHKSACITFDGKKLKQGLTEDSGDVDLLGFEKGTSLKERKQDFERELADIDDMMKALVDLLQETDSKGGNDEIDSSLHCKIRSILGKCMTSLSVNINEIDRVRNRKLYCKQKLLENSGQDWRKGKYVYAISAITAYIHEIDGFAAKATSVIDKLCRYIAHLNNEMFVDDTMVNLQSHERYLRIENQLEQHSQTTNTRLIPQRSEQWHGLRKEAKITGSTIYQAIGCDGLARQKDHFEKVMCGVSEKEPSPEAKAAMNHGTVNEINAVATAVGKIIPVLAPNLMFCEEGCSKLPFQDDKSFMIVSPDGSLRRSCDMATTEIAIEIKCPTKTVHSEFSPRYYLQCQAEMIALDVNSLIYISWTEKETTVFTLKRDDELFKEALNIAFGIYGVNNPKKPTRLTQESKIMKDEINQKSKLVKMVGRFASCKTKDGSNSYATMIYTHEGLLNLLNDVRQCYKERYELLRIKATEAVVFILADLDRSWQMNTIRCSPIAPKGYSLDCETMRRIAEEVHTRCTNNGIHVPCQSFDGQWHTLVVRSVTGAPLTTLQLQKDVWKSVEKMAKKDIVSELAQLNKEVIVLDIRETNEESEKPKRHMDVTNGSISLPTYRKAVRKETKQKVAEIDEDLCVTTLADSISDVVRASADVSDDVLALTDVTDRIEQEAFASNTHDEAWCRELESVQDCLDEIREQNNVIENSVLVSECDTTDTL